MTVEKNYENLEEDDDKIILSNMPKKYKFDDVFTFKDNRETLH